MARTEKKGKVTTGKPKPGQHTTRKSKVKPPRKDDKYPLDKHNAQRRD